MVKAMPDQSSAADEHAILQEITAPLATLPDDPMPEVADVHFPVALRGYDRLAVDAYVKKTSQLVAELQATRSPDAAIRRALERVGEEVSGILKRAHETADLRSPLNRAARPRTASWWPATRRVSLWPAPSSRSRTWTATPTGSGPSAIGSSATPEVWHRNCSRSRSRRASGFRRPRRRPRPRPSRSSAEPMEPEPQAEEGPGADVTAVLPALEPEQDEDDR